MRTEEQKENAAKKLIKTGKQQDSKTYNDFSVIAEEEQESERRRETLELHSIRTKLQRYTQTSLLRVGTAFWVMFIVSMWLMGVLKILHDCGLKKLTLSSEVIIALLTTTTANILGLPLVVLRGLYPKEKEMEMIDNEIEKLKDMDKDNYL